MKNFYHPLSWRELEKFGQSKPHGILILGASSVAQSETANLLSKMISAKPEINVIWIRKPQKRASITIDQVRELYTLSSRKKTTENQRQVIIIEFAELLSLPAQHALLKLLEEPADITHFILTASQVDQLLPTVRSRLQILRLRPLTVSAFAEALEMDPNSAERLYALSSGDAWKASELNNEVYSDYINSVKQLLIKPLGLALLDASRLVSDKTSALVLAEMLGKLCAAGAKNHSGKNHAAWLKRWDSTLRAQDDLRNSNLSKLIIDRLLIELRSV